MDSTEITANLPDGWVTMYPLCSFLKKTLKIASETSNLFIGNYNTVKLGRCYSSYYFCRESLRILQTLLEHKTRTRFWLFSRIFNLVLYYIFHWFLNFRPKWESKIFGTTPLQIQFKWKISQNSEPILLKIGDFETKERTFRITVSIFDHKSFHLISINLKLLLSVTFDDDVIISISSISKWCTVSKFLTANQMPNWGQCCHKHQSNQFIKEYIG